MTPPPVPLAVGRLTADAQWLGVAMLAAARGTCSRARVGAVLVLDEGRHLYTGRNGAPPGAPHCQHADGAPCAVAVHAEANLFHAVPLGTRLDLARAATGPTLYVTHAPCLACAWLICRLHVARVVYRHAYRDPAGLTHLDARGVRTEQLP